jgi:hypothetical protein
MGKGCPSCGGKTILNTETFIENARRVHGDKYDYSRSKYVTARRNVVITCPEHGDFEQTPNRHVSQGSGCTHCGRTAQIESQTLTTETFIAKARQVHGDRYDYSKSVYRGTHRKLIVTCPEHGDFEQTAGNHTMAQGCPSCAVSGYQTRKTGYLYFLLDTDTHSRIKIGISNDVTQRIQKLRRETPFPFEPMEIIKTYGEIAPQLEKLCHDALPSANLTGFDVATEWMKYDGDKVRQLIETCESYRLLDTLLHIR